MKYAALSAEELFEVISAGEDANDCVVTGKIDRDDNSAVFYTKDGNHYEVNLSVFEDRPTKPNYQQFEIIDHGRTIKFGEYECEALFVIKGKCR